MPNPSSNGDRLSHAAVLGSGMAGLAAAAVLAARCERVTVFEKDPAPEARGFRRGVPQGRHGHILLKAGERALESTFPGLTAELEAGGSCRVNFGTDMAWFHHGIWKVVYDSPIVIFMQGRPFLEALMRERLAALGNVRIRYGAAVCGIEIAHGRATAVRVRESSDGSPEEEIAADLIVDATGRGSSLVCWLTGQGYPAPREDRLPIDLAYSSRIYRPRQDPKRSWKAMLLYHKPPQETRAGLIFPLEDGTWVATLAGYLGDHPPTDAGGFEDFARSLPQPTLYEAIREAEPLSEVHAFRFPYARWTRFDTMASFPAGLLPLGDTVCSFDPVFGQGMSVAAQSARLLATHLDRDPRAAKVRRFLKSQAWLVAAPWLLTSSEDLRYGQVDAPRPFWMAWLQRYNQRVFRLTGSNAADYDRLLRVLHLVAPPPLLFHPATLMRVLASAVRSG